MKQILISALLFFIFNSIYAQDKSFKEQAIEQFKNENYPLAINLMEKALNKNSNDAEVYYYLGVFNHYNAYDSTPLKGYNNDYSNKILKYLEEALRLNPKYGNARYFYFTQCSADAVKAYQQNNLSEIKTCFEKAFKKGVIPSWAIELGKNMLNSCENDAILFTHGDFSLNICLFVQLHYGYRKDISVIPLTLLDRPSFDLALNKNKNSEIIRGVDLGISKEQILDMHPYKWDTTTVSLSIPLNLIKQYSLQKDYKFDWKVEPDLYSERTVSRIKGAEIKRQAYLSPTRAMLLNIIETNKWTRPIYFTNTFEKYYLAGLDKYFQYCGLVSKLTPMKTKDTPYEINESTLIDLVFNKKLKNLKTIIDNDEPRVSNIIYLYYGSYYSLAEHFKSVGKYDEISKIIQKYKQNLLIGFNSKNENSYLEELVKMK